MKFKIYHHEECGSTNDEAWKLAPGPAVVLTERQTAGRGRLGREWKSSNKNLLCSIVFPGFSKNAQLVPVIAGIAAAQSLSLSLEMHIDREAVVKNPFRLRWPNDLYFREKKFGGILSESRSNGNSITAFVVGLGININEAAELADRATTSLSVEYSVEFPKKKLIETFLSHWPEKTAELSVLLMENRLEEVRNLWNGFAQSEKYPNDELEFEKLF